MYTKPQNTVLDVYFLGSRFVHLSMSSMVLLTISIGIAIGISVVLINNPAYILIGLVALILFAGAVFSVQFGLLAMVFILYTRLSDIMVHVHNGPSVAQGFIALLVLAIIVRWSIFHENPTGWLKLAILLGLYGLVGFVSIIYAESTMQVISGLLYFVKDAIIAVIVAVLLQTIHDFRRVVWVLILVSIFLGTLSVYQFLSGSFDSNFGGFATAQIMQIIGETNDYRIGGPIGDPNYFAQIMIVIAPLALERLHHDTKIYRRGLALWALIVIVLSVVFTYSRGGLLALLVTIALFYFIYPPRVFQVPILILVIILFLGFAPNKYIDRIFSLNQLFSSSNALRVDDSALRSRVNENLAAWEMIKANPLFGVGLSNYSEVYTRFSRNLGVTVPNGGIAAHNLYLEVLAEAGLVGFAIFIFLIYTAINTLYKAFRKFKILYINDSAGLVAGFGIGMIGYLTAASFIHGAYPRYFYLLIGICISLERVLHHSLESYNKEQKSATIR